MRCRRNRAMKARIQHGKNRGDGDKVSRKQRRHLDHRVPGEQIACRKARGVTTVETRATTKNTPNAGSAACGTGRTNHAGEQGPGSEQNRVPAGRAADPPRIRIPPAATNSASRSVTNSRYSVRKRCPRPAPQRGRCRLRPPSARGEQRPKTRQSSSSGDGKSRAPPSVSARSIRANPGTAVKAPGRPFLGLGLAPDVAARASAGRPAGGSRSPGDCARSRGPDAVRHRQATGIASSRWARRAGAAENLHRAAAAPRPREVPDAPYLWRPASAATQPDQQDDRRSP